MRVPRSSFPYRAMLSRRSIHPPLLQLALPLLVPLPLSTLVSSLFSRPSLSHRSPFLARFSTTAYIYLPTTGIHRFCSVRRSRNSAN